MRERDFIGVKASLSKNLKFLRGKKRLAQERLALEAGVDRTVISKIERMVSNPSLEILVKLATTLEVQVHELLLDQPDQD